MNSKIENKSAPIIGVFILLAMVGISFAVGVLWERAFSRMSEIQSIETQLKLINANVTAACLK